MKDVHPELLSEWSTEDNSVSPDEITYGSKRKVTWIGRCGHKWIMSVKHRSNGCGCPYCSGHRVLSGFNDLATIRPDLVNEWSSLNDSLLPSDVTAWSHKRIWWKCSKCGYEWDTKVEDRTRGRGCPVCAGKIVSTGRNDILSVRPDLLAEWDYEKNKGVSPLTTSLRSHRKIFWKCAFGHSWIDMVYKRVEGAACPVCREMKSSEFKRTRVSALKYYARKSGFTVKEDEKEPLGISLQVFFPECRTAVEFAEYEEYAKKQRQWENGKNWLCLKSGIKMIRVLSPEVRDFNNCICITMIDDSYDALTTTLKLIFNFAGIPVDVDVERDIRKFGGCDQDK